MEYNQIKIKGSYLNRAGVMEWQYNSESACKHKACDSLEPPVHELNPNKV